MTIKAASFFVSCLLVIGLSACENKPGENANVKENQQRVTSTINENSDIFAEANYSFKNITSTKLHELFRYKHGKVYTDSTYKTALRELTRGQKKKLIVPVLTKELKVSPDYLVQYMNAYFVSLQEKSGNYQPIILRIFGDDYDALTMIVLDNTERVIDHYVLSGGKQPGPYDIGDSLSVYQDDLESKLNRNRIVSYRVIKASFKDSTRNNDYLDSTIFNGYIKPISGSISVKKNNEVKKYIKKEGIGF
jgi:hypothetical protein